MEQDRYSQAIKVFSIDESQTSVHLGEIIQHSSPMAYWKSDFADFILFMQKVKPSVVHLSDESGEVGFRLHLQFVVNSVIYNSIWVTDNFVESGDEDFDAELAEDFVDEFADIFSQARSRSDLYSDKFDQQLAMTEAINSEIESSDLIRKASNSIECYGPKKIMDRRRAVNNFVAKELGDKFPEFEWNAGIYGFFDAFQESINMKHNSVEKDLLGNLGELHREISSSEADWDSWKVTTKKKVAETWLRMTYGFESAVVAEELSSYRSDV